MITEQTANELNRTVDKLREDIRRGNEMPKENLRIEDLTDNFIKQRIRDVVKDDPGLIHDFLDAILKLTELPFKMKEKGLI